MTERLRGSPHPAWGRVPYRAKPSPRVLLAAGMVLVSWVATFALAVPAHDLLQPTWFNRAVVTLLVAGKWVRTVAWTLAFVLLPFA